MIFCILIKKNGISKQKIYFFNKTTETLGIHIHEFFEGLYVPDWIKIPKIHKLFSDLFINTVKYRIHQILIQDILKTHARFI